MEMSPDLRLMVFPFRTYRQLLGEPPRISGLDVLRRPAMSAAILGTSVAVWATNHVSVRLVASLLVCWGFVVAIQLAAAVALIAPARRRIPFSSALDLLFVAHGPWSLWLIGSAVWVTLSSPIGRPAQFHASTGLAPAIWTAILIFAFCRTVLDCGRREAVRRTLVHQAIIWSVTLVLFAFAVQLWPRIEAMLR